MKTLANPVPGLFLQTPELELSVLKVEKSEEKCDLCGEPLFFGDFVVPDSESEGATYLHVECLRDDNERGTELLNVTEDLPQ